jgi:dehydrogenase/reductase SDR family protein 7
MIIVIICLVLIVLALHAIWLLFADGDLTLMWYERFGQRAEVLKGQVVWITGASSGIGKHLAYQCAKHGCRIVLSARNVNQLEEVRKECLAFGRFLKSDDIMVLPLDIVDTSSHCAATDKVLKAFGQIDILINNAGRSQRAWIADTELAVDREMIELNVIGQVSLTKSVLPHMIERRSGHVVVTSSLAGKMGIPFSGTYCLTKWAINGWFHSLAIEMASKNISVTIACPGPVFSNISDVAFVGKAGQTYGQDQSNDKNRMQTSRCAELMFIAVANKLHEVWISRHPALLMTYCTQYLPTISAIYLRKVGVEKLMLAREGK